MWRSILSMCRCLARPWRCLAVWSADTTNGMMSAEQAGSGKVNPHDLEFEPDEDVRKLTSRDIDEFSRRCTQFPEVPPNG